MTHHLPMPPYEEISKLIEYDPDKGEFRWLVGLEGRKRNAGDVAGNPSEHGYRIIYVAEFKRSFRAARLAWYLQTGEDPGVDEIDHLDRNKLNDKFKNLEPKTRSANAVNTRTSTRCKSGIRGVWQKSDGKWGAKISREGVHRTLGQAFDSKEKAARAYDEAALAHERGEW